MSIHDSSDVEVTSFSGICLNSDQGGVTGNKDICLSNVRLTMNTSKNCLGKGQSRTTEGD